MYISDEHSRDILAAIPSQMMAKGDRARLERIVLIELDEIIGTYYGVLSTRREDYPFAKERKRWRRIDKLTEQLAQQMRKLRRETPWSDPDPLLPNRVLAVLWEVHMRAQVRLEQLDIRAFRGTQDPHRESLYSGVLRVWTEVLNGQLKYSRNWQGKPIGPLVRFLTACVEPILGEETPRAGIADIIDRERNRRAKHPV
jgi:hypothetical protein